MSPCRRCSSEWHRPAATYLMSTSPALGGSSSSSTISKSWPDPRRTAAFVFIDPPELPGPAVGCGRTTRTRAAGPDTAAVTIGAADDDLGCHPRVAPGAE